MRSARFDDVGCSGRGARCRPEQLSNSATFPSDSGSIALPSLSVKVRPVSAALAGACDAFSEAINARPHAATRRPPVEVLAEERFRLHPLPPSPTPRRWA